MSIRAVELSADSSKFDRAMEGAMDRLHDLDDKQRLINEEADATDKKLTVLEKKGSQITLKTLAMARKVGALVAYVAIRSGSAMQQALAFTLEATILIAETLVERAAAESLTLFGALTAGLKIAAAGGLFIQAAKIVTLLESEDSDMNQNIQGLLMLAATFN